MVVACSTVERHTAVRTEGLRSARNPTMLPPNQRSKAKQKTSSVIPEYASQTCTTKWYVFGDINT